MSVFMLLLTTLIHSDLRAALELAVDNLVSVCKKHNLDQTRQNNEKSPIRSRGALHVYSSDSEETEVCVVKQEGTRRTMLQDVFEHCPEEVVNAVRRYFCPALRDLIQHGLLPVRF